MMTNEVLHIGDRNKSQAIAYLSTRLAYLKLTKITHVEVIAGLNLTKEDIAEIIRTNEKFAHSVEAVDIHEATVYIILK